MRSLRHQLLKPWVIMPLVALLALGGWFTFGPDDEAGTTTAVAGPEQVVAATTGTMAQTVSAEGTIAAAETDDLSFSSSGTVTAVNVAAGDTVKAGAVLATIDSAELASAVADAEASVADAEAKLADDTDAAASDAQIEADTSSLVTAQDALEAAQEALDGAQLVASFEGTVVSVDLTVGEKLGSGGTGGTSTTGTGSGSGQSSSTLGSSGVGAGASPVGSASTDASATSATAQIQVVSTGRFTVELSFDTTDIAHLAAGQTAEVALSTSTSATATGGFPGGGFPGGPDATATTTTTTAAADEGSAATTAPSATGDSVTGLVTEVGKVADASSGVASYPVTVVFNDSSGDFNVGATVSVDISYAEVTDVVQVPSRAVSATNGTSTVTVRTDGQDETRTVTTGLTADGMVEITSGLVAGEQVVITMPGRPGGTAGSSGSSGSSGTDQMPIPPAGFDPSQMQGAGEGTGS